MPSISAIRELSGEQMHHELREAQQSLFRLRVQHATERNDVPSQTSKLKKRIARIKTIIRERELAGGQG